MKKIINKQNSFFWSYGLPSLVTTVVAILVLAPAAIFLSKTEEARPEQGPLLAASIALFLLLAIVHQYLAWKSKKKFSRTLNSLHSGINSLREDSPSKELDTEEIPEDVKLALSELNDEILGLKKTTAELEQVVTEKEHQRSLTVAAAGAADWEYETASKSFKVDKEWRDRLGFPKQKDPSEFLSQVMPEDRKILLKQLSSPGENPNQMIEVPVRLNKEHGTTRWVTVKGQVVDEKNKLLTGVLMDLTPAKVLEGNQVISERMEDLGHLAGGIAHEINTPMQFLGDNLGFIKKGQDRIQQYLAACEELLNHEHLQPALSAELEALAELKKKLKIERMLNRLGQATTDSEEGIQRVSTIVKAMKEYAHPETDTKAECDLNAIINTALTVGRSEWKYVAKADLNLAEDLKSLRAFPGELTQVVLNLVTNAALSLIHI